MIPGTQSIPLEYYSVGVAFFALCESSGNNIAGGECDVYLGQSFGTAATFIHRVVQTVASEGVRLCCALNPINGHPPANLN